MITVNIPKAKEIAHVARRADRDVKMKPLDVEATIPLFAESAEEQRQDIRDSNALVQSSIESASSVEELKTILSNIS